MRARWLTPLRGCFGMVCCFQVGSVERVFVVPFAGVVVSDCWVNADVECLQFVQPIGGFLLLSPLVAL